MKAQDQAILNTMIVFVERQIEENAKAIELLKQKKNKELLKKAIAIRDELIELNNLADDWFDAEKRGFFRRKLNRTKLALKFSNKVRKFQFKYKSYVKDINNYLGDY